MNSAIKNSSYIYPDGRITVNLGPADMKKEGPYFDLLIALGILASSGQLNAQDLSDYCLLGELSLDGKVRAINGTLPIALSLRKENSHRKLILLYENANEAAVEGCIEGYPVKTLFKAVGFISGNIPIPVQSVDLS